MQKTRRQDLYHAFIDFIQTETHRERTVVNRRMFSVFFWCFILPALVSLSVLVLINLRFVPARMRNHLDLVVLFFPVSYSIYFLSWEVLRQVPSAFRRGGISNTLNECVKEGDWRERVCDGMTKQLAVTVPDEWAFILASFRADLRALQYRTRYLTALAGAVFFLIMQGIDSIGDGEKKVSWVKDPILGWVENGREDPSQFVGLALFLVLLYLSGNQTYNVLSRYLACAELAAAAAEQNARNKRQ